MAQVNTYGSEVFVINAPITVNARSVSSPIAVNKFIAKARGTSAVLKYYDSQAHVATGVFYTVPAGQSLTIERVGKQTDLELGFFAVEAGTDTIEIICIG